MQVLESMLSLAFFLMISSAMLASVQPKTIDDSLYRIQLGNDAWRVLFLRGALEDLDLNGHGSQDRIRAELKGMGDDTSLCFFFSGVDLSNCPGPHGREPVMIMKRTVIDNGIPRKIAFSMQK
ncbi:MAG: hypothetical protein AB1324_00845 [Candidatus Micrarchaeota archaeon]